VIQKSARKLAKKVDLEAITFKRFTNRLAKRLGLEEDNRERLRKTKRSLIMKIMEEEMEAKDA